MVEKIKALYTYLTRYQNLFEIVAALRARGARSYIVGGSVRDLFLGVDIKDIDIEVHGATIEQLEDVLKKFGVVRLVGKQFGVLRIDGLDIDWSLPRRDSAGRHPTVEIDPHMTIEQAARRRDLTINAMAIDISQEPYELHDPYGGQSDIECGVLRAVDKVLFLEDPLRFWRVVQFIGRFEMCPDAALTKICMSMSLDGVASERVSVELEKLFLKSTRPSLGIRWVKDIGVLERFFPELAACVGVHQREDYHPEGDVFEHLMQSLDAAAAIEVGGSKHHISYLSQKEKLMICWAALCHDLGKATCTDEDGRAYGHDQEGIAPTKSLLRRFGSDGKMGRSVVTLVRYHLRPWALLDQKAKRPAYKRLALKLSPDLSLRQLALLALCDTRGRNGNGQIPLATGVDTFDAFILKASEASVVEKPEPPVLLGRHLLDVVAPGKQMGQLLAQAYEIQISEGISDVEELKSRVLEKKLGDG